MRNRIAIPLLLLLMLVLLIAAPTLADTSNTASPIAPEDPVPLILSSLTSHPLHLPAIFSYRYPTVDDYDSRKAQLLVAAAQPFVDDPLRDFETDLDKRSFDQINDLECPVPIDNPNGWSGVFRTGGRPFLNFDEIRINDDLWAPELCGPGGSGIPQSELDDHYAAGKTVNRIWLTHKASNGYPIVLVMTPDGFFNPAGAEAPMLQGAALRTGFIGEPFGPDDYLQHTDELNIIEVDDNTLSILYSIHSQAGEGVAEIRLEWNQENETPELHFRSAHATRFNSKLGFAGINFMRGPTLSGLLSQSGGPEGGIEAFHDGRSVFVVTKDGAVTRDLLIPPTNAGVVVRKDIVADIGSHARLEMDQPQGVQDYFSYTPTPTYDQRADIVLMLETSDTQPISVRKASVAVDLASSNPEAQETANVFYAASMVTDQLHEFTYQVQVTAEDFEQQHSQRQQGVVFISDRSESGPRLYFLPLDENLAPVTPPEPLTDKVIVDPHNPSVSIAGRFVIFDADDYDVSTRQRIYTLDLLTAAVRRLTVDPFGASGDWGASFNAERTQFAMITSRQGTNYQLNIQDVADGLGPGVGDKVANADAADWSQTRNEIALTRIGQLSLFDVDSSTSSVLISRAGMDHPKFSPSGNRIAYTADSGLYVIDRDGSNDSLLHPDCIQPAWIDEQVLVVVCEGTGNTDLYLLDSITGSDIRLTTDLADDTEPAFVPEIAPTSLDIDIVAGQPQLTWFDLFEGIDFYEVWRSPKAHFVPGDDGSENIEPNVSEPVNPADSISYMDTSSHMGDVTTNDYYLVHAFGPSDALLHRFNRVGAFDFPLTSGE